MHIADRSYTTKKTLIVDDDFKIQKILNKALKIKYIKLKLLQFPDMIQKKIENKY